MQCEKNIMKKESNHTYIIAEIGINHEGNPDVCKEMIFQAAECGVDAVKLQTINADANYAKGTESYDIFKTAELTRLQTESAFDYARDCGLDIFTTAGDVATIDWVDQLKPSHWKVSSGLLTHIPIIEYLALLKRPLLISTGMAQQSDIDLALKAARSKGAEDISLFQCTSIYPTPINEVNLAAIKWLRETYNCPVGLSDHTVGDDSVFLSIGAGATLIEKHFSLDPTRVGFDHKVSLDTDGLKTMVERIRLAEVLMGTGKKIVSPRLQETRNKFLRYIVALQPIAETDSFSKDNIGIKRTLPYVKGISPKEIVNLFGKVSGRKYNIDEVIIVDGDKEFIQ